MDGGGEDPGRGPGGPFGAGLRRVLGGGGGTGLAPCAGSGGEGADGPRGCRLGSAGAAAAPRRFHLSRSRSPAPVPPHPPPASQIFFSGGCWQAAGLFGRNINGSRRSRRCPGTSGPKGEEGEGERERGETREPSLGEGGCSPPAPSPWSPPKSLATQAQPPHASPTFSPPMRFGTPTDADGGSGVPTAGDAGLVGIPHPPEPHFGWGLGGATPFFGPNQG